MEKGLGYVFKNFDRKQHGTFQRRGFFIRS